MVTVSGDGESRVNVGPGGSMDLDHVFRYHPPTPEQIPMYEEIRDAGHEMAKVVSRLAPSSPERSQALSRIREAVMWANTAIACAPAPPPGEQKTARPAVEDQAPSTAPSDQ